MKVKTEEYKNEQVDNLIEHTLFNFNRLKREGYDKEIILAILVNLESALPTYIEGINND
jgi:hypothetical protein